VQECVDAPVKSRKQTLELARKGGADEHPKRKRRKINDSFESSQAIDSPPTRRTRSSARIGRQGSIPASQEVIALDSDNEDDRDYEQAQEEELQEPSDGLVACPMCNKRMKEEAVFSHLDRCNGQPVQETPPATLPKPKLAKLPQQ
jgi:E3 ubiquitin-protein ligase RAD18